MIDVMNSVHSIMAGVDRDLPKIACMTAGDYAQVQAMKTFTDAAKFLFRKRFPNLNDNVSNRVDASDLDRFLGLTDYALISAKSGFVPDTDRRRFVDMGHDKKSRQVHDQSVREECHEEDYGHFIEKCPLLQGDEIRAKTSEDREYISSLTQET